MKLFLLLIFVLAATTNMVHAQCVSSATNFCVTVAAKTPTGPLADKAGGFASGYFVDGAETPELTLTAGVTYTFDCSDASVTQALFALTIGDAEAGSAPGQPTPGTPEGLSGAPASTDGASQVLTFTPTATDAETTWYMASSTTGILYVGNAVNVVAQDDTDICGEGCADLAGCSASSGVCVCTPLTGTCGDNACGASLGTCVAGEELCTDNECECDNANDFYGVAGACVECHPSTCPGDEDKNTCNAAGECVCTPLTGAECGADGCGGVQGVCGDNASCNGGTCECDDDYFGDGQTCVFCTTANCVATVGALATCNEAGACVCTPVEDGECGDNGCGVSFGTCGENAICTDNLCECDLFNDFYGIDGVNCTLCVEEDCEEEFGELAVCNEMGECVCTPDCDGLNCGDDGCGGSCGTCGGSDVCNHGVCGAVCTPDCNGVECGDDGCGGSCGSCEGDETCEDGFCEMPCVPTCMETDMCGPDGCNGTCGTCEDGFQCVDHNCTLACTPQCDGVECGDDGCGGSCGSCEGGAECSAEGVCECAPDCEGKECGDDGCGGSCGTCEGGETCSALFECECTPQCDGKECGDDGCGGSCGSCEGGEECSVTGVCACAPDCEGKECGDDGCGGSCGTCDDGDFCNAFFECECTPQCGENLCGTDGCDGNCGVCDDGAECLDATGFRSCSAGVFAFVLDMSQDAFNAAGGANVLLEEISQTTGADEADLFVIGFEEVDVIDRAVNAVQLLVAVQVATPAVKDAVADATYTTLLGVPVVSVEEAEAPSGQSPPRAAAVEHESITVEWDEPADSGSVPTVQRYQLQRDNEDDAAVLDNEFFTVYDGNKRFTTVEELYASTNYHFRVRALSLFGSSEWSAASVLRTAEAGVPEVVEDVTVGGVTHDEFTVTWGEPEDDNGREVTSYQLEVAQEGPLGVNSHPFDRVYVGLEREFTVEDLRDETGYRVRVRAINEVGPSAWSEDVETTTGQTPLLDLDDEDDKDDKVRVHGLVALVSTTVFCLVLVAVFQYVRKVEKRDNERLKWFSFGFLLLAVFGILSTIVWAATFY